MEDLLGLDVRDWEYYILRKRTLGLEVGDTFKERLQYLAECRGNDENYELKA